jgi:hypothetical protein
MTIKKDDMPDGVRANVNGCSCLAVHNHGGEGVTTEGVTVYVVPVQGCALHSDPKFWAPGWRR